MPDIKPQVYKDPRPAEYFTRFHERSRTHEPDWVYDLARVILTPPTLLVYRARPIGVEHVPTTGPVILAPNHFSQWDHFFAGVFLRRKVRFMAKSQLFSNPVIEFIFRHGGAFPVRRGYHDEEAFITAHAILDRGGCLLMYPEGGRSRTGGLREPRPGVGRIALESGAPVIPVAIHGSLGVRRWRKLHFPKVTVDYGEPMTFDVVAEPTREQQLGAATQIFMRVREMYDSLDASTRTSRRVPSGTPHRAPGRSRPGDTHGGTAAAPAASGATGGDREGGAAPGPPPAA
jgi:1-acyl-sn-glycerol-3-phosphate acyltransferase